MNHIVLLGLMGAGKTEVGRRLAERLERPLLDCDGELEDRTDGRTAREVAEAEGIDVLHRMEAEVALDMLGTATPAVIGPAASVIEVDAVRDAMAGHTVVWLTGPVDLLAEKAAGKDHRPLVQDGDAAEVIAEQLRVREPLAVALADLVIDISTMSREEQTEAVVELVRSKGG